MEFIRQVGGQAEVNDGGKIRRLPFSGVGVPPQPGARVNPVRDACCCPGAVPLEPNKVKEEALKSDPRRTTINTNNKNKLIDKFIGLDFDYSPNKTRPWLGYNLPYLLEYGFGREKFNSLKGGFNFGCYAEDTWLNPYGDMVIVWDSLTKNFKLQKASPLKKVFVWSEGTYGTTTSGRNAALLPLFKSLKKDFTLEKITSPNRLQKSNLIIKVLDAGRDHFTDGSGNVMRDKGGVREFLVRYPEGEFWVSQQGKADRDTLLAWAKNPEDKRFIYERLY